MRDVSFAAPLFTVPLPSDTGWPVTLTDGLLTLGILMLLCEVIKGARPGAKYLTDHLLSLLVFCGAGAEFALLPQFGTSTFFLLTLLALADFLSGIALRRRRGPKVAAAPAVSRRDARNAEAAAARIPSSNRCPRRSPRPQPLRWSARRPRPCSPRSRHRPRCRPPVCSRAMVRIPPGIHRANPWMTGSGDLAQVTWLR
jgi:hypothetical protein